MNAGRRPSSISRRWRRRPAFVFASILLGLAASSCADTTPTADGVGTVTKVVDGDTIHVAIHGTDEKIRLIGMDTPETHGKGGLRECYGQEGTDNMQLMAPPGTKVRLVRDVESRDKYGRLLAYVYRVRDGKFLNLEQVRLGFADDFPFPPNTTFRSQFAQAKSLAQSKNIGLWKACGNADVALN